MNQPVNRRALLRALLFAVPAASLLARRSAAQGTAPAGSSGTEERSGTFTLPPLPYKFDALEPFIDKKTMELHHDKHHATYVKNLNDATAKYPALQVKSPESLIIALDQVPEAIRTTIRNNAGGHVNHSLFWSLMKPKDGGGKKNAALPEPTGDLLAAINATYGSTENLRVAFNDAGLKRFGSGWVWLAKDSNNKLQILSTPNQDSPLMAEYGGLYPVIGNDVWEHAYYLKYQNRRAEYLQAWWNTVNWDTVQSRFLARGGTA